MDVHVPYGITIGLRLRGVDVLAAQEDGSRELADAALLDRATNLGRSMRVFAETRMFLRKTCLIAKYQGYEPYLALFEQPSRKSCSGLVCIKTKIFTSTA